MLLGLLVGVPLGGGLATLLVSRLQASTNQAWALVPVLVASREVAAGAVVRPDDLVESTFPGPLVTPSCATPDTKGRFVGQTMRWPVTAGVVLRDTDLIGVDPACAERVAEALGQVDGGAGGADQVASALLKKHGGGP